MKRAELKKILKPLIKECIKEVIFEDGTLSAIISEVVRGTSTQQPIMERKQPPQKLESRQEATARRQSKLQSHKEKLLKSIGRDTFYGVNLFEGTVPSTSRSENAMTPQGSKALDGIAPSDAGVDLTGFGLPTGIWKKLAGN